MRDQPLAGEHHRQRSVAWAGVLGGLTALGSGLPAALFALDTTPAHVRADLINRGLGLGFRIGDGRRPVDVCLIRR